MKKFFQWGSVLLIFLGLSSLCFSLFAANAPTVVGSQKFAYVLEINGGIGPAIADFVKRGLEKAAEKKATILILKMDTPGGLSTSMRDIIKDILASKVPVVAYVAPSGARAASAGTYIMYASHIAAMAPGTNLGAATPVSISLPKQGKEKGKSKKKSPSELKAINDAKAYIRSLAELRGRNVTWAEQAVTKAKSLSANSALKKNVIDVIANSIPQLLEKINNRKVLVNGQLEILHTLHLRIEKILPDWRTKFLSVITDPSVAYILLMIGFYGLFFEFVNPGFVLPGVLGGVSLLLALYAFQLLPINYAGLGLIILGMAFIVAEAFMPSFGALGIGGVISFAIGSIMLMRTGQVGFTLPWQLIVGITVSTLIFFIGIMQLAFRARRRRVVSGIENMIGKEGIIEITGKQTWVLLGGERWKVKSDQTLTSGQKVCIIKVEDLTLVVTAK